MTINERVGDNVAVLMQKKNMSTVDLAEAVGCHRPYISDLIRGKINPTIERVEQIADALGVSVQRLFK